MQTISPSQMRSMACRQRHFWSYKEGYRAKNSGVALELGSGIHEALDHFYSGKKEPTAVDFFSKWMDDKIKMINKRFPDEKDDFIDAKTLGKAMLKGYFEEYDDGKKDQFDVIHTEQTLSRPLPLPIPGTKRMSKCRVVVRLDGLVRDHKTGKLFSLEHKTFKAFEEKSIETDPQFTAQVWVGQSLAKQLGLNEEVMGVIYNGLRKQAPSKRVKAPLFRRFNIYRNQKQIESFLFTAYWLYRESRKWKVFPQPSPRECGICDFREPCTELMRGGNWQFLLKENYNKRRPRKK